jgi:hypothetical protein
MELAEIVMNKMRNSPRVVALVGDRCAVWLRIDCICFNLIEGGDIKDFYLEYSVLGAS